jgi:hypothetical protein
LVDPFLLILDGLQDLRRIGVSLALRWPSRPGPTDSPQREFQHSYRLTDQRTAENMCPESDAGTFGYRNQAQVTSALALTLPAN